VGTMACDPLGSTLFAAYAANSCAFFPAYNSTKATCNPSNVTIACHPSRALPFLEIHGTADTTIPYYGGFLTFICLPTIPYYVTQWAIRDGLGSSNVTTVLPGGNVQYQWGSGAKLGLVTHYMIPGLRHKWAVDFNGFSTSPTMLNFFSKYTL